MGGMPIQRYELGQFHLTRESKQHLQDEEVFEKTLREPLRTYQVHGHLQAQRLITQPVARSNHCNLRVLGTFEDGSRKLLTLRDAGGPGM
eukprot:s2478_g12.t1